MRRAVPDVIASTMGQPNPGLVTSGKPYRWRGIPGWKPGDERFREENRPAPGGRANTARKRARLERFAAALAPAGGPERASDADIREAGKAVGVGEKTARKYRADLLRQQGGDS
jgi:hypothetical protein